VSSIDCKTISVKNECEAFLLVALFDCSGCLIGLSMKVSLCVLWGARCREARERGERERQMKLHPPFAIHAAIQWAI